MKMPKAKVSVPKMGTGGISYGGTPEQKAAILGGAVTGAMIGGPHGAKIGGKMAGGMAGYNPSSGGGGMGGGSPLDDMPTLGAMKGLDQGSIRGIDLYRPTTVSGQDIQNEMNVSPWLRMAMDKQSAEQARQLNQVNSQTAGNIASARSNLAMRGGLRSGAAERLALSGMDASLAASQGVRAAGAVERGQLGMQGADLTQRMLQQNAAARTAAQASNVQAGLQDLAAQRGWDMTNYQEKMKGYAAARTGEAIGKDPKPGLFSDPVGYLGGWMGVK